MGGIAVSTINGAYRYWGSRRESVARRLHVYAFRHLCRIDPLGLVR
ncbi:MAG: hypothetical protein MP439_03205 [Ferrimicrobium sp.]|nr:hypothetical protein [Ferrimicrobium sp.]